MSQQENKIMKVALLGDSVFDNRRYVNFDHEDVEHVLKESGVDCELYAIDGSLISGVKSQLDEIKKDLENISHIFLSVGGNNGIEALRLIFMNLNTDEFFKSFQKQLDNLYSEIYGITNERKIPVHILNVYYPCFDFAGYRMLAEINHPQYRDTIIRSADKLNGIIKDTAGRYSFGLIDINSEFNEQKFYANEIEPSYEGSKLLTKLILEVIQKDYKILEENNGKNI